MDKFRHFVFDLDGTLIDTEHPVLLGWQKSLELKGCFLTLEQIKPMLGIPMETVLDMLNIPWEDSFVDLWMDCYETFADEACFFDGVPEMLDALKAAGCGIGAVTSRHRAEYDRYFPKFKLEKWMDYIVLKEDTALNKPNPEPLLRYMELAGATADETIYIGDMPSDAKCANRAGATSAIVTWNGATVDMSDAKLAIASPKDVIGMIK